MELFYFFTLVILIFEIHYSAEVAKDRFFTTSTNFLRVARTPAFVDKSKFIKYIFDSPYMILTAPSGFGKSTNLDMLKQFVSIPINQTEKEIRLKTFHKLSIYKEYPQFVNETFGSYPVLYVDFNCDKPVDKYDTAVEIMADIAHDCYKTHSYLVNSEKLSDDNKKDIKNWCDETFYIHMSNLEISDALRNLVCYLFLHHNGRKIFLLLENYDAVTTSAAGQTCADSFEAIDGLFYEVMVQLVRVTAHVGRAVITGLSNKLNDRLSHVNHLEIYKFLGNHKLVGFFGLLEEEVRHLFAKFNLRAEGAANIHDWGEGYFCDGGTQIYNIYSVLNYIKVRMRSNS